MRIQQRAAFSLWYTYLSPRLDRASIRCCYMCVVQRQLKISHTSICQGSFVLCTEEKMSGDGDGWGWLWKKELLRCCSRSLILRTKRKRLVHLLRVRDLSRPGRCFYCSYPPPLPSLSLRLFIWIRAGRHCANLLCSLSEESGRRRRQLRVRVNVPYLGQCHHSSTVGTVYYAS